MEVSPNIHIERGEKKEQIIFGGVRASGFIRKVVAGELVDGKRYGFNAEFILELHDRLCNSVGVKGFIRENSSTTVGGIPVTSFGKDLEDKFYLYCRWLEEATGELKQNPEDIISALQVAAAAHYGLTMPALHPFDNGNGRTARALVNAVLMSQTYELTAHRLAIPPVPILRSASEDDNRYMRALRMVGETRTLNPLMVFLAQKWIGNLTDRLAKMQEVVKKPIREADSLLFEKLKWRKATLESFVQNGVQEGGKNSDLGKNNSKQQHRVYPIPNYFEARNIRA